METHFCDCETAATWKRPQLTRTLDCGRPTNRFSGSRKWLLFCDYAVMEAWTHTCLCCHLCISIACSIKVKLLKFSSSWGILAFFGFTHKCHGKETGVAFRKPYSIKMLVFAANICYSILQDGNILAYWSFWPIFTHNPFGRQTGLISSPVMRYKDCSRILFLQFHV